MGRWLAIDHGTVQIGVAAGNTSDGIASPVTVVAAEPLKQAIERIGELAGEYQAEGIVVGWALNMDDTEGPQGRLTRRVACRIAEGTGLDVRLWDERLSSFSADRTARGMFTRKKHKARRDALAAAAILQDFLACGGPEGAPRPDEIDSEP